MTPSPTGAPHAGLPRGGLVAVALIAAGLLPVTAGWVHAGVVARARELAAAQGQVFMMALVSSGRPSIEGLEAFVAGHADEGLRWLAMVDRDGTVLAEAGTASPGAALPDRDHPLVEVGDRVRLLATPPPPPGPPDAPPGAAPGGRPPPAIVLEYVPLGAADLRTRSARALGVAAAGALLLVVAAVLLGRQLQRADAAERDVARHRHLAGLGEMSAVLAHEIRNPLAALKGHAQLLTELLPPADASRARADRVVDEAVRLERLTDDLLAFARTGAIERADVDPREPLRDAVSGLGSERIVLTMGAAPARWCLDAARVRQVLTNLLQNALQAAPGGTVEVIVADEAGALTYTVRDHGPGLPPGEEESIFEPFRTHRARGTGLGLAVARRLVELHRGRITATNHPDGGALFRVSLPPA